MLLVIAGAICKLLAPAPMSVHPLRSGPPSDPRLRSETTGLRRCQTPSNSGIFGRFQPAHRGQPGPYRFAVLISPVGAWRRETLQTPSPSSHSAAENFGIPTHVLTSRFVVGHHLGVK